MQYLNSIHLSEENKANYLQSFTQAKPFKHLVIDNFLNEEKAEYLFQHFPEYEKFNKKYDGLNEKKAEGSNFEDFDKEFSNLREEVMSVDFCKFISEITGIENVFVTDDALGAGLHQGKQGSFLDVHIDFSMHHQKDVYRRLNLLIFFNKNWQDAWAGHTELWNEDMSECVKKVRPDYNRALIFMTTGKSYHGYGKINPPEEVTRKSFYTYFYTNVPGEQDGNYHDTIFKTRPEEGSIKKIKTTLKENLKNSIKVTLKKIGVKF